MKTCFFPSPNFLPSVQRPYSLEKQTRKKKACIFWLTFHELCFVNGEGDLIFLPPSCLNRPSSITAVSVIAHLWHYFWVFPVSPWASWGQIFHSSLSWTVLSYSDPVHNGPSNMWLLRELESNSWPPWSDQIPGAPPGSWLCPALSALGPMTWGPFPLSPFLRRKHSILFLQRESEANF